MVFDNSKIAGIAIFGTERQRKRLEQRLYIDEGLNRDTGTAEGSKPDAGDLPEKGKAPTQGGNGSVSDPADPARARRSASRRGSRRP